MRVPVPDMLRISDGGDFVNTSNGSVPVRMPLVVSRATSRASTATGPDRPGGTDTQPDRLGVRVGKNSVSSADWVTLRKTPVKLSPIPLLPHPEPGLTPRHRQVNADWATGTGADQGPGTFAAAPTWTW